MGSAENEYEVKREAVTELANSKQQKTERATFEIKDAV